MDLPDACAPTPPPGFQGLRADIPIVIYRRNLPHWRQVGASYFVTFRLGDSLPAHLTRQLKRLRSAWELHHPEPQSDAELEELTKMISSKQERWLDNGHGSCLLGIDTHQAVLASAFRHFGSASDAPRYELGAYVIMPNHVHLIIRPTQPESYPLEKIIKSWKRFASREINRLRGTSDGIWEDESFDRIIRNLTHLSRCVRYIGRNPAKAGLPSDRCPRWLNPTWVKRGWRFDCDLKES